MQVGVLDRLALQRLGLEEAQPCDSGAIPSRPQLLRQLIHNDVLVWAQFISTKKIQNKHFTKQIPSYVLLQNGDKSVAATWQRKCSGGFCFFAIFLTK